MMLKTQQTVPSKPCLAYRRVEAHATSISAEVTVLGTVRRAGSQVLGQMNARTASKAQGDTCAMPCALRWAAHILEMVEPACFI